MTPELLVILCGLFVLVLCIAAWAAEQIGPDPSDAAYDRRQAHVRERGR